MADLPLVAAAGGMVPDWIGPYDAPWLDALGLLARQIDGQPLRVWREALASPLPVPVRPARLRAAAVAIEALFRIEAPDPPPRLPLFRAVTAQRTAGRYERSLAIAGVAATYGIAAEALDKGLYADLASERIVRVPPLPPAEALAVAANLAIAQRVVRSATEIDVVLYGRVRAVLRQITLCRLLSIAEPAPHGVRVRISGPVALFRHTTRYGRELASVLPVLRGAEAFVLTANVRGERPVRLSSEDPLFPPGLAPPIFDSRLEARFAEDFAAAAPAWEIVREPEPVRVDGTFVFPDFAIVHRRDPSRRWLVELVGYWSDAYLDAKLARLARAGRREMIVCVDRQRGGGQRDWSRAGRVVWFERRLDPAAVLAIVDGSG